MKRILELDGLRGIAALIIILGHVGLIYCSNWVISTVDLFFVISGYLITTNVMKKRREPGFLKVFYTRRALRIWPAYYLALGACLLLNRGLKWDSPPDAWPYYLTFTQNVQDYLGWPAPKFSGMFIHTWTLAIEEQFYVFWPLLLFRTGRRTSLALILAFVALPPAMRASGYSPYLLLARCDGLAVGSILALVVFDRERVARNLASYSRAFAAVGLGALVLPELAGLAWPESASGRVVGALFTTRACLVYFSLAGLVVCFHGRPALKLLRHPRICHIGAISYGLYLYHPLVFAAMPGPYKRLVFSKLGVTSTVLMEFAMVVVCFVLAELSWRYVEMPIHEIKERLTSRRAARASAYRGPHMAASATATEFGSRGG